MARRWERRRPDPPLLIGVIHLLPLPGSPRPSPGLAAVIRRAVDDAERLRDAGFDLAIVENLGDAPFVADTAGPFVVAAMTRVALAIRDTVPELPLGINVLRNDALAALGVAAAVAADLVRVNVHVGATVTDQGVVQGRARDTLLERNRLGVQVHPGSRAARGAIEVAIAADVRVKHAQPLGLAYDLHQAAQDTALRGGADVLLVTGSGTGAPTSSIDLGVVQRAVPTVPVWVASGVTPSNVSHLPADGYIIGTWLHSDGDLTAPLDPVRLAAMRRAAV